MTGEVCNLVVTLSETKGLGKENLTEILRYTQNDVH
jgi:hypothetical protein